MSLVKRALGHLILCKDVSRLVSQMQERDLGPVERLRLKLHLDWCTACADFERQMHFLSEAMRRYRG
jgi:Putative zinc-finger